MNELVICPRCNCTILAEHKNMNCHGHNDTNKWLREIAFGEAMVIVARTRVLDENNTTSKAINKGA